MRNFAYNPQQKIWGNLRLGNTEKKEILDGINEMNRI
jgi:hypothetical protein